jgi:hypothetical protein
MAEIKKDLKLVEPVDPTTIFDDLESLRKQTQPIVQKHELLTSVPVGPPSADCYFRVHPDPAMTLPAKVIRLKDDKDRRVYYVTHHMEGHPLLMARVRRTLLVVTYSWPTRQLGIWPVPMDTEGAGASWWESARSAYECAKTQYTQLAPGGERYIVSVAEGEIPPVEWPNRALSELLKIGLKDRVINNDDHPVMLRLRGIS